MELEESAPRLLQCVVVTPEKALLDEKVSFVALPMYDGELGVLPGRAPLIGRLGFGELRTQSDRGTRRYFIEGGFVQVRNNVVTVLTSKAIPAEDIKVDVAERMLAEALEGEATDEKKKAQDRARGQLRVARHSGTMANARAH